MTLISEVKSGDIYNIADMIQRGLGTDNIMREIELCEVVCFNCHMRRERQRRESMTERAKMHAISNTS